MALDEEPSPEDEALLQAAFHAADAAEDAARQQALFGLAFQLLETAGLEAGKPARRLLIQLGLGVIRGDTNLQDIYPVSPEDAFRLAAARVLRLAGKEAPPYGSGLTT